MTNIAHPEGSLFDFDIPDPRIITKARQSSAYDDRFDEGISSPETAESVGERGALYTRAVPFLGRISLERPLGWVKSINQEAVNNQKVDRLVKGFRELTELARDRGQKAATSIRL